MSKTFAEELDEIMLKPASWQYDDWLKAKKSLLKLVEERIIGEGEIHVSHVCPKDNIECAKFAQRCMTMRYQRQRLYEGVEE